MKNQRIQKKEKRVSWKGHEESSRRLDCCSPGFQTKMPNTIGFDAKCFEMSHFRIQIFETKPLQGTSLYFLELRPGKLIQHK